jgi:hypothetical protein
VGVKILAIDPGNEQSAFCCLDDGKPTDAWKVPNHELLAGLRNVFNPGEPLAIEMVASYGMAVGREVFETCVWIGRFAEAWECRGGDVEFIFRKDVKLHLCETVRANDANIRAAIIDRYGPGKEKAIGTKKAPGPLFGIKGDEWSALAVALTYKAKLFAQKEAA